MMRDPAETDWRTADASEVMYAARDGVQQAQAELRRREAAVGAGDPQRAVRKAMKNLRNT